MNWLYSSEGVLTLAVLHVSCLCLSNKKKDPITYRNTTAHLEVAQFFSDVVEDIIPLSTR